MEAGKSRTCVYNLGSSRPRFPSPSQSPVLAEGKAAVTPVAFAQLPQLLPNPLEKLCVQMVTNFRPGLG